MFSEVVLGIKNVITTDGKRPTISSDANYLTFLFHSFEWKVGLSIRCFPVLRFQGSREGPLGTQCPTSSVGLETGEWRRCRSLSFTPPALGPAPLVTYPHRPSQAGGYTRDCANLWWFNIYSKL